MLQPSGLNHPLDEPPSLDWVVPHWFHSGFYKLHTHLRLLHGVIACDTSAAEG
jgi:hypothetical protein